ncbi:MAG: transposase, partial [Abditibacteriota bacterium]|nr:transposase [Abditibacteriota bacterium]
MDTFTNNTTSNTETIEVSRAEYEAQKTEIAKYESKIVDLEAYISELESELNWFKEQFRLSQNRRFGASSEGSSQEVLDQMSLLFNEAEATVEAQAEEHAEKETEVRGYTRKKRSGSLRDVVPANTEVEEVRHELPEEERVCPECGKTMQPIGTEVRETLKVIPAKAVIRRDVYVVYGCANCRDTGIEVPIVETPKEPALIPGSFASPEAVANIIIQKFQMCVPLYRQEQYWNGQKIMLSRQVMSDWVLKSADMAYPLFDRLHRFLGFAAVMHDDETTMQVLHEA